RRGVGSRPGSTLGAASDRRAPPGRRARDRSPSAPPGPGGLRQRAQEAAPQRGGGAGARGPAPPPPPPLPPPRAPAPALLARFSSGPGARLWPWSDDSGRLLPEGNGSLSPEVAGFCFFVLLTRAASERRARGGPSRGLSGPFAEAGFGGGEWLPDRADDLAVRLLAAGTGDAVPRGELLAALQVLLRATLSPAPDSNGTALTLQRLGLDLAQGEAAAMLDRARVRLPEL